MPLSAIIAERSVSSAAKPRPTPIVVHHAVAAPVYKPVVVHNRPIPRADIDVVPIGHNAVPVNSDVVVAAVNYRVAMSIYSIGPRCRKPLRRCGSN